MCSNVSLRMLTSLFGAAGQLASSPAGNYNPIANRGRTDFRGTDQFRYQRTNLDNPNDRLNGEILITVTVK